MQIRPSTIIIIEDIAYGSLRDTLHEAYITNVKKDLKIVLDQDAQPSWSSKFMFFCVDKRQP